MEWKFEDIKMMIGTDLPIFTDNSSCVSLRLRYVCLHAVRVSVSACGYGMYVSMRLGYLSQSAVTVCVLACGYGVCVSLRLRYVSVYKVTLQNLPKMFAKLLLSMC